MTAILQGYYWIDGQDLKRPVRIEARGQPDGSVDVYNNLTGIAGSGPTLEVAIEDFRDAVAGFHKVLLHDRQHRGLGGPAIDMLRWLEHHCVTPVG